MLGLLESDEGWNGGSHMGDGEGGSHRERAPQSSKVPALQPLTCTQEGEAGEKESNSSLLAPFDLLPVPPTHKPPGSQRTTERSRDAVSRSPPPTTVETGQWVEHEPGTGSKAEND